MRYLLTGLSLLLMGCASPFMSRLVYESADGAKMIVEIPKEIEAKKLKVNFNAQQGTAEITAESWISRNQDTIKAEGNRQKQILEGSAVLIEKGIEAGVKAAIKSAVPIP